MNLIGQRFGRLVAVSRSGKDNFGNKCWLCKCDCGNEKSIAQPSLRAGKTRSCGCLTKEKSSKQGKSNRTDLTGKRFGRLTVIKKSVSKLTKKKEIRTMWVCKCDCGNLVEVMTSNLTTGHTSSCGCFQKEKMKEFQKKRQGELYHIMKDKYWVEGTSLNVIKQTKARSDNKSSGIRGVYFIKQTGAWRACMTFQGKVVLNKNFKKKEDAIRARREAEETYIKPMLDKYEKSVN